jgi:ATP/ADP translocase
MTVLLLAVTFGAANKVKYLSKKIAAWDPSKHPKGAKGMFVDTPDKAKAKHVKPGDVIVTKSGKPFVV